DKSTGKTTLCTWCTSRHVLIVAQKLTPILTAQQKIIHIFLTKQIAPHQGPQLRFVRVVRF
ncbi:hypothetical protein QUH51_10825, partial [Citrobacter freundii]|uniref:hypothetical protein n=1 Tax=Citrobacter freundii TaxID=546 RepID=UPI0025A0ABE6